MKKIAFLLLFVAFSSVSVFAQKVAYVDMDKIMSSIPDYELAQRQLEELSETWRQEIAKEYGKVETMYKDFQAREVLMSDEMRKQKEEEIVKKEKEVREMQKQKFGPNGELFQKRKALIQPIQEKVYKAIEKYAKERRFDFILTAPDGNTVIYAKSDKDVTDDVIKRIK
jgi:outer membrane protein